MKSVLFVSKPVAPPWTDSNKNLVRDLASGMSRYKPHVLVPRGVGAPSPRGVAEPVYAGAGAYAPALSANVRVLARLFAGPRTDLWHFFFAPNPPTLHAGRIAARVRRQPTVHTIASAPDALERIAPALFADRLVVLSEHTRARLARIGVPSTHIPPALTVPDVSSQRLDEACARHGLAPGFVLYPGDLEFGNGARTFIETAAREPSRRWVVASRPKTPLALEAARTLADAARGLGANVHWIGETPDIHALLAAASHVVLVTDTLHAKMDWPLVLLEAIALGTPVFVATDGAAAEIAPSGAAFTVRAGDPAALAEALAAWDRTNVATRTAVLDRARAWVEDQCAPVAVAARYEALYDELLSQRASQRL